MFIYNLSSCFMTIACTITLALASSFSPIPLLAPRCCWVEGLYPLYRCVHYYYYYYWYYWYYWYYYY